MELTNTYEIYTCYHCAFPIVLDDGFKHYLSRTKENFHCNKCGGTQYFPSKTKEQLKVEAAQKALEKEVRKTADLQLKLCRANASKEVVTKQYQKVIKRIKNGVCPCCNRTFSNLADHMKTKHADLGTGGVLKQFRINFGKSQFELADELGLPDAYISNFERNKAVPKHVRITLEAWVIEQSEGA